MSFLIDFIEKLQEKPKEERQRIMWLAVAICALIIFAGWIFSLKYTIKSAVEEGNETEFIPQDAKKSFQEFKNQIPTIKQNLESGAGALFEQGQGEKTPFENQNNE